MKFWLVLTSFCIAAFAQFMSLSDFAFMMSQKEKLNIVFDKSVEKNITVFVSPQSTSTNYLELLNAVLRANNLDSFRVSDTLVISQSKTSDFSPAGGSLNSQNQSFGHSNPFAQNSRDKNSLSYDPAVSNVTVSNGSNILYSAPFGRSDKNVSSNCHDCIFEPLKLNFLNISDLTDFLKFSGTKYHYIKNINTIIFETPKDDNASVQKVIDVVKLLDIPKQQVQLRLAIFENNLNKLTDIGFNPSLTVNFSTLSKTGANCSRVTPFLTFMPLYAS